MTARNLIPAPVAGLDEVAALLDLIKNPDKVSAAVDEYRRVMADLTRLVEVHTSVSEAAQFVEKIRADLDAAAAAFEEAQRTLEEANKTATDRIEDAIAVTKAHEENRASREQAFLASCRVANDDIRKRVEEVTAREELVASKEELLAASEKSLDEKHAEVDVRLAKLRGVMS